MLLKPAIMHPWHVCEKDAVIIQNELANRVIREDHLHEVKFVAGVDAAYDEKSAQNFAAAVVLNSASLEMEEFTTAQESIRFPYVPGLFSFREVPAIVQAIKKLKIIPDLIVCDGQGIAHPRRFGLASHLGVLFNIPTIGCSKTKLIGKAEAPGPKRGEATHLLDNDEIIGCMLRTQDNIKPLYVSIGHLISLRTACDWILRLSSHFRLPETTRKADQIVRRCKNEFLKANKAEIA